ncbi:MAG: DUF6443 domain-containing protein, partial [Flavobacteriales bacterium]|nr:DUF6443 domain-containing protein [Flavobacteriales bacterium]
CAGNLNGLDIWLSGTYIVEMEAIAPGDYANMHVEWEQHDISSNEMDLAALDALPVGGVRIGKITYHDGISSASDRVVQYEYVQNDNVSNPNLSSGRLLDFPRYDWVMRMYRELPSWGDPNDPMNMPDCANRVCRFNALNSSSKTPLGASNGSHVVYPEVNVIYGASAEGGKTIKTFSYANDWGGSGFPFTFKTNMDWKRGKLLSQKDFKKNPNGSFSLVREVYNEWDFREDETVNNNTIIGLKVDKRIQGGQCFYASTYTCDPTNVTEVYYGNCVTASVDLGNLLTGSSPLELDTSSGFFSSAGLTGIEAAFAAINCDTVGTHVCFGQQPGTLLNNPLWGEEIAYRSYEVNSQWTYLKSSTEIVDGVKKVTEYVYDETAGHHTNPIETITYGSDGTTYRTKNTYAFSMHQNAGVLTPEVAGIEALKQFHINVPIEHVQTIQKINGQEKTISGTLVEFGDENGKPTKKAVWTLETSAPISNFTNAHVFDYNNVGTLYKSANYVNNGDDAPEFEYISYNNKNQLLEYKSHFGETNSIIWKSDINKPVATITNATHNEVLYTSFESTHDNGLGLKLNMGSFVYNNSKCGSKSYQLGTNATVKIEFIPVGTYRLSYWQTSGNCDIRLNGSLLKSKSVPGTVNGFKKQDMIIEVPTGGSVLIMEGNSILDELRMYPEDARMKSFVYDLDDIKVVAISDENNIPSTYAYDAFNRLVMIKDFNEDIIQTMEYAIDQTSSLNAITEKTITVEGIKTLSQVNGLNNKEALQSVTYLDGFSRPIQKVLVAQSPGERDIVEITEYDNLGLNPKTYLPFTTGTMGGAFISNAKIAQNIFHGGNLVQNSFAYAEAVKEASPLARDLSTGSPGKAWAIGEGHERFMNYRTNALNEVRLFSNGTSTGAYDDSTLFVSQIIDEDGNSITMYKDKLGREIMQDNEGAKTYTIYDDFGRIAVVIPPQLFDDMSKDNNFNYLSPTYKLGTYNYTYDARGRLIRKDLPGSDVHQFYYDRLDREVLSIDPNDNKIFAKYDILGREIMTGSYNGTAVPSNADGLYELENNSLNGYSTSNAFPSANTEIYTVTYFDHYDFNRNGQSETIELFKPQAGSMYSLAASSNTIGLATGSKIAVFDEKNNPFQYLTSSTFIDEKSRVIQTKSENILNEVDINSFSFDFLGNVQNEKKEQRATFASGATKSYVIDKRYTYDHTGRLIDTYHTINSGNEVLLSRNSYDEKSQLKRKSLGGKSGSNQFLQNIDYKYNIRGWLTDINDINKKGVIDVQVGSGSSSNNK